MGLTEYDAIGFVILYIAVICYFVYLSMTSGKPDAFECFEKSWTRQAMAIGIVLQMVTLGLAWVYVIEKDPMNKNISYLFVAHIIGCLIWVYQFLFYGDKLEYSLPTLFYMIATMGALISICTDRTCSVYLYLYMAWLVWIFACYAYVSKNKENRNKMIKPVQEKIDLVTEVASDVTETAEKALEEVTEAQ